MYDLCATRKHNIFLSPLSKSRAIVSLGSLYWEAIFLPAKWCAGDDDKLLQLYWLWFSSTGTAKHHMLRWSKMVSLEAASNGCLNPSTNADGRTSVFRWQLPTDSGDSRWIWGHLRLNSLVYEEKGQKVFIRSRSVKKCLLCSFVYHSVLHTGNKLVKVHSTDSWFHRA